MTQRNIVFISHANPEDNLFAEWLTLRLSASGYSVWCDVVNLLGGEPFWKDIEQVLRQRAIKVISVISSASNQKAGVRRELGLADTVKRGIDDDDFIIPIRLDAIPFAEHNILVHELNAIDFSVSWANGLAQLLKKLSKDNIPTCTDATPSAVAAWWQHRYDSQSQVSCNSDMYLSNTFVVCDLPEHLFYHRFPRRVLKRECTWPCHEYRDGMLSLTPASELVEASTQASFNPSSRVPVRSILNGESPPWAHAVTLRRVLSWLLTDLWHKELSSRGMLTYSLSTNQRCHYLPQSLIHKNVVKFTGVDGQQRRKSLIGYQRIGSKEQKAICYWHYALQMRPRFEPDVHVIIKAHIVFSGDGNTPWESKDRMHSARRRLTRNWHNDRWRDLLIASMSWLGAPESTMTMETGGNGLFRISTTPRRFRSPVSIVNVDSIAEPQSPDDAALDEVDLDEGGHDV